MANQPFGVKKISEQAPAPGGVFTTAGKLLPIKNHLYLAVVTSDTSAPSQALSGAGLTWVSVNSRSQAAYTLTVFRALKTSSAGLVEDNIVASFGGQAQGNVSIQIYDINFVDTSGTDGSGAVVQSNNYSAGSGVSNTSATVALSAFGDATNNGFFAAVIHATAEDTVPENTWTELDDLLIGSGSTAQTTFHTGEDGDRKNVVTWATQSLVIMVQVEIKMRGATAMVLGLAQPSTVETAGAVNVLQTGVSSGAGLAETTRGGLVQRVGEQLGLAYDRAGYEQTFLRSLWDRAIKDVLLRTHCNVRIGDMPLSNGVSEYRLPTSVLAILDGRVSTPAGLGHYNVITLDEMISRQSTNPASDSYRKYVAIQGSDLLIVSPTPSTSETLRIFYIAAATASSSDSNDFTNQTYGGLPSWCADAVEYYMLWKAAEFDDKSAPLKPTYRDLYLTTVAEVKRNTRRKQDRRDPASRIGYPSRRQAVPTKNSQYPR